MDYFNSFVGTASNTKKKRLEALSNIGKAIVVNGVLEVILSAIAFARHGFWVDRVFVMIFGVYMVLVGALVCKNVKNLTKCKVISYLALASIGLLYGLYILGESIYIFDNLYKKDYEQFATLFLEGWGAVNVWIDYLLLLLQIILYSISIFISILILRYNKTNDSEYHQVEANMKSQVCTIKIPLNENTDNLACEEQIENSPEMFKDTKKLITK